MITHSTPSDIEKTSMGIISSELDKLGITIPEENLPVVKRVIHTTADFDFAENLKFTSGAVKLGIEAVLKGCTIVTDTNMALAGITKPGLRKTGSGAVCHMAEADIAENAKALGITRAVASMRKASTETPDAVFAVGNAPTALFELCDLMEKGIRPSLIIAVPVGFVNVVEAKEKVFETCLRYDIPCIAAMGRKGGSTIAAAICNALIYSATDMLDPVKRGWN